MLLYHRPPWFLFLSFRGTAFPKKYLVERRYPAFPLDYITREDARIRA